MATTDSTPATARDLAGAALTAIGSVVCGTTLYRCSIHSVRPATEREIILASRSWPATLTTSPSDILARHHFEDLTDDVPHEAELEVELQKASVHQKVYHYLNHHNEYNDNDPLISHFPGHPQHKHEKDSWRNGGSKKEVKHEN